MSDNNIHTVQKDDATKGSVGVQGVLMESASFSGPLPPPSHLAEYEKIQKGFAERIIRMAEKEQDERHRNNRMMVDSDIKAKSRGQMFGFILGLLIIALAGVLGCIGHTTLAGVLVSTALVGELIIFVLGKVPSSKE